MYLIALVSVLVIEGMKDEGVMPSVVGSSWGNLFTGDSTDSVESFGGKGGWVRFRLGSLVDAVEALLSVEITDDAFPLRMLVSTKPDADELSELELLHVCTPWAFASRSCKSLPASTLVTHPSAASMDNSTAGLGRDTAGATGEPGRSNEAPGVSVLRLCRKASLIESSAVGSLGCSLRVITAEYVSGSCHPVSSSSGSGSKVVLERNRFREDPGVKKEERVSSGIDGGGIGRTAETLVVDMLANSRW